MAKDQYVQMRKELLSLWKNLARESNRFLPASRDAIRENLEHVNDIVSKIGGSTAHDLEKLKKDVDRFLMGELTKDEIELMFQDALKLEQDTREL